MVGRLDEHELPRLLADRPRDTAPLLLSADISESHPSVRGAIIGLSSDFLAVGQIIGALGGGWAADWADIDRPLAGSLVLLAAALLSSRQLRAGEHLVGITQHLEPSTAS